MYEVEVKLRADHGPVRDQLAASDATSLGTITQTDTYYDHPCRSFVETDEALRIRREVDETGVNTARVTYKGPLVEQASKTREEHETVIGDPEAFAAALSNLGFEPVATVEKERSQFAVQDVHVSLDAVTGLGSFVEVETEGPRDAVESLRTEVYEVCRDLGLDPTTQIRTSYLELLLRERDSNEPMGNTSE